MKKVSYFFAILFFICCVFTACKKDKDDPIPPPNNNSNNNNAADTIPPVITISGANPTYHTLNSTYVDPGATAVDDIDGAVAVINNMSSANPNVNLAGTYIITYSAIDSAGNLAMATRTVNVENSVMNLGGNYAVTDTCSGIPFSYTQTITASTTVNGRIHFSKFSDYMNNSGIYADVSGTSVTLPSQTANNIGSLNEDHQFSGSGSFVTSPNVVILIDYTDFNITASITANCSAWFIKQ